MSIRIDGTNTTANPGITGSDTDTGLQFGTNEVKVVTDGSDRVTVDSSGRVLVAITTSDANAGADDLQIGDRTASTERGITIGSTAGGGIRFADADSTNAGIVEYQHSSNNLRFYTNATERVQITGNGTVKLISSGGIDFSGIQTNASGMTSETLDSYEEGTWTPNVTFAGNAVGLTYSMRGGIYTKIGRLVTCYGAFSLSNKGSSTGNVLVTGLPFTASDNVNLTGIEGGGHSIYQDSFSGTNAGPMQCAVINSQSYFELLRTASTSPGSTGNVSNSNVTNTSQIRFTLAYTTTS